jgi:hypothetical protein
MGCVHAVNAAGRCDGCNAKSVGEYIAPKRTTHSAATMGNFSVPDRKGLEGMHSQRGTISKETWNIGPSKRAA